MGTKTYDIVSDFGATGNGIKKYLGEATISITNGTKVLSSPVALWNPATDVGKCIGFSTEDIGGDGYGTIFFGANNPIAAVAGDGKSVTLTNNFTGTTLTNSNQSVEWGTNDTAAFLAFNAAALAWQAANPLDDIVLNIVGPGRFIGGLSYPFNGIKNFTLVCSGGAIISNCNGGVDNYPIEFGSGVGQPADFSHSTRVATVSAGATSITVVPDPNLPGATTVADACSLFDVGDFALITGADLQSSLGYPSNPYFFEYVEITNINSSTGVITFAAPLQFGYKSTWPCFNNYGIDTMDYGGPGTLYALNQQWVINQEYIDVIADTPRTYFSSGGHTILWTNPTWISSELSSTSPSFATSGSYPSMNYSWSINGGQGGVFNHEVDKLIQSVTITNFTGGVFASQSTGANYSVFDNCTLSAITGTSRHTTIRNCTLDELTVGAYSYGGSETLILENNVIGSTLGNGIEWQGKLSEGINNIPGASMTDGVIAIPTSYITSSDGTSSWMAPGAWITFRDHSQFLSTPKYFQITDLTQDATHTYVHTTAPGTWPSWSYVTVLGIGVHPCPDVTVTDCAENSPPTVDDGSYLYGLSQGPNNIPYRSYYRVRLTNATLATANYWILWGHIYKFNVTVVTPYGGAPAATIGPKPLNTGLYLDDSYSSTEYLVSINLKVEGARSLLVTGSYPAIWSGGQSGDSLPNLTEPLWWPDSVFKVATDLSGDPGNQCVVILELQTDQGITDDPDPPAPEILTYNAFHAFHNHSRMVVRRGRR